MKLLGGALLAAGLALAGPLLAQSSPVPAAGGPEAAGRAAGAPTRYLPNRFAGRAGQYYRMVWGIEAPAVKLVESGEIIRFAWHVVDAERAAALNDKRTEPLLVDLQAGVSLSVPAMENVGQLRQVATPVAGRSYWMAFSNKGRKVKRGDRVNVVIGTFRAEGLVVD